MKLAGSSGVLALLTAAATASGAAQKPPVFRADVENVYVDAFVTRGGQPVAGLTAADFELRDNGVRQRPELAAAASLPLLAVLVFDTSSSMEGERLAALRASGEAFLAGLRPADEAALVTFSHKLSWLAGPTSDKDSVRRTLAQLRAAGATAAYDALYAGIAMSDKGVRPLVVLFSDGEDNVSFLGARQVRAVAERSNALVHVVAWRSESRSAWPPVSVRGMPPLIETPTPEPEDIRLLRQIAEATGGRLWGADSPARLREAFAAIADAMGQRYVLSYSPSGVKREGWHQLEVKLRGQKGDVHARRGYWVAQ